MKTLFATNALALVMALALALAGAANADVQRAVALVYHHVSDETPAATSVTPKEFKTHLDYLADEGYTVLALGDILARLERGDGVPDKTVAITFDDAYESVLTTAAPALKRRGWPFTVFVATDAIDQGLKPYLSWDELRKLKSFGAELANHSATHGHMIRRSEGQSEKAWLRAQRENIERAARRLDDEIGEIAPLFAFPYGEYDEKLVGLVTELGLKPIGQHSGAMTAGDSVIPRFPVSSRYASLTTLRDKLRSVPMPVTVVRPADGVLSAKDERPELTLRFDEGFRNASALTCFVAGQPKAEIRFDGQLARIQATKPLKPGRTKYNCTLPSTDERGRFHWFSFLWMKPQSDTQWYAE